MGFVWGLTSQNTTKLIRSFALVLLLLGSANSSALGLDDITVSSAVGERFYGIIKLKNSRGVQPNEVIVSLAPRSVYQRMGVDWEYFHTTLIFDVLEDERGEIYLRVVSSDVLFEPYLDFVLSVRWPSGYLSKQYTVLLEMPPLAPIENRVTAPAANRQSAEPQATTQTTTQATTQATTQTTEQAKTAAVTASPITRPTSTRQAASKPVTSNTISTAIERSDRVKPLANKEPLASKEPLAGKEPSANKEPLPYKEPLANDKPLANPEESTTDTSVSEAPAVENKSIDAPVVPSSADPLVAASIAEESKTEPAIPAAIAEPITAEPITEEAAVTPAIKKEVNVEPKATIEAASVVEQENIPEQETTVEQASTVEQETRIEEAVIEETVTEEVIPEQISSVETAEEENVAEAPVADTSQAWAHTTRAGDNLWRVARKIQAESGGNLKHIVDALYQNNPTAFMGNNADRLKVDARLSVSLAQIRAMSPQANRNLAKDTVDTGGSTAGSHTPQPDNAKANPDTTQSNSPAGVLSLVANDNSDNTNISPETLALGERADTLTQDYEQQLAATKNRSSNVEERIDNLYQQYSALSEKTEQLKALEQALNRSIAEKAQANLELEGVDAAVVLAGDPLSTTDQAINPTTQAPTTENADAETESTPAAPTRTQLILTAVLVVLIIVLLIVMLKFQQLRRRAALAENWQLEETFNPHTGQTITTKAADNSTDETVDSATAVSLDQIDASLAASRKELSEIEQQHARNNALEAEQTQNASGQEGAVELEASVYIAYERYDEAEQLLEQALEHEPNNSVLQSQLLEVYAAKGKQQHFELLAAQIGNKGDRQIDSKINILRNSI